MTNQWKDISRDLPAERRQLASLLSRLRSAEPRFAEASILQPDEVGGWHAAVYLLTGCEPVWTALGSAVVAQGSLEPVREELNVASGVWTTTDRMAMEWALHFWRPDRFTAAYPATFGRFLFTRWIVASFLRKGLAPTIRLEWI
jgi:hypothetical protein